MGDEGTNATEFVQVSPGRRLRQSDRGKRAIPAIPLVRVNNRHYLSRFHHSAKSRARTTYIPPEMEPVVEEDRHAINRGDAAWNQGDSTWTIQDRIYHDEGTGTFYPIAGDGFHPANHAVNVILNYLELAGGETPRAFFLISVMDRVEQADIDYAIWLWRKRVPRG